MLRTFKVVAGAALVAAVSAAQAAELPPEVLDKVIGACRSDYHRVCNFVLPGDGRIGRCLLDHERELSVPCLGALKIAYAVEACMPDYRQLCPGVPRGPEAMRCLSGQLNALSSQCREVVAANAPYTQSSPDRYGSSGYSDRETYGNATPPSQSYGARPYEDRRYEGSEDDRYREGDRGWRDSYRDRNGDADRREEGYGEPAQPPANGDGNGPRNRDQYADTNREDEGGPNASAGSGSSGIEPFYKDRRGEPQNWQPYGTGRYPDRD